MDYRRLQHSYPPRPSPLGTSESRVDRQFDTTVDSRGQPGPERPRAYSSATFTPSPSQISRSSATQGSHAPFQRDTRTYMPSRPAQTGHRRHGSLETGNQTHTHRRNNSQPQAVKYRSGMLLTVSLFLPRYFISRGSLVPMPRIHEDSKNRRFAAASTFLIPWDSAYLRVGRSESLRLPHVNSPTQDYTKTHPSLPLMDFPRWRRSTGRQLGSASPGQV